MKNAAGSTPAARAGSVPAAAVKSAAMASTSASTSGSCAAFSAERMVTVSFRTVMFFSGAKISRMSPPLVGAQEPFSTKATVRFWMLCAARSCKSASMVTKIPALYVGAANRRWL